MPQHIFEDKTVSETPKVYAAIAAVMAEMAEDGISKARKNQQQGYQFRGIDDVYNALSPVLAKHRLCMLPAVLDRQCDERQTKSGGALFYVTVRVRFDLVSAEDGSKHEVFTFGEAMDSADKATNKAMSAAYKYAAMQAFCIPTEGDNDADAHHHEPQYRGAQAAQPAYINALQKAKIEAMLKATGAGLERFLAHYQAESLEKFPASAFEAAIAALNARKSKAEAQAAGGAA